jgi:hypothetical protein
LRLPRQAISLADGLAAEPSLSADTQASLDGSIFLAVAYRRPHEHDADDHERDDRKKHDEHHGEGIHLLSLAAGWRIYRRRQERKADGWVALAPAVSQFEDAAEFDYVNDPTTTGVWDEVLRGPWRDRGVDPTDAHEHSNVSSWPGSPAHPFTWPSVGPPSESR